LPLSAKLGCDGSCRGSEAGGAVGDAFLASGTAETA